MLRLSGDNPNIRGLSQSHVDRQEGGLDDDKSDSGGITNYGVSLKYLQDRNDNLGDINRDGVVDANDVRAVTKRNQHALFGNDFWDAQQLDKMPPRVAFSMYDAGVNCGAATANKWLQKALGVKADGIIGDETLAALAKCNTDDLDRKLALNICDLRGKHYNRVATRYPKNQKYLKGWQNRNNACRRFINNYSYTAD